MEFAVVLEGGDKVEIGEMKLGYRQRRLIQK